MGEWVGDPGRSNHWSRFDWFQFHCVFLTGAITVHSFIWRTVRFTCHNKQRSRSALCKIAFHIFVSGILGLDNISAVLHYNVYNFHMLRVHVYGHNHFMQFLESILFPSCVILQSNWYEAWKYWLHVYVNAQKCFAKTTRRQRRSWQISTCF